MILSCRFAEMHLCELNLKRKKHFFIIFGKRCVYAVISFRFLVYMLLFNVSGSIDSYEKDTVLKEYYVDLNNLHTVLLSPRRRMLRV